MPSFLPMKINHLKIFKCKFLIVALYWPNMTVQLRGALKSAKHKKIGRVIFSSGVVFCATYITVWERAPLSKWAASFAVLLQKYTVAQIERSMKISHNVNIVKSIFSSMPFTGQGCFDSSFSLHSLSLLTRSQIVSCELGRQVAINLCACPATSHPKNVHGISNIFSMP